MSVPGPQGPGTIGSPVPSGTSSDGLLAANGCGPTGPATHSGAERAEISYNASPMVCDESCPPVIGSHVLPSQPALSPQQQPQPSLTQQNAGVPVAPMAPPVPASSPFYPPPSPYGTVWTGASGGLPVVSASPFLPPSPYPSGVDVFPGSSGVANAAVSSEALTQFYLQQQQRSLQYAVAAAAAQHQQQQHYAMLHQRQQQMLAAAAVAAATNGSLYRCPGGYLLPSVPSLASLLSGSAAPGGAAGVLAGIPNIPSQEEAAKRAAFEQKARIAAQASVSEENVSKLNISISAPADSASVPSVKERGGGTPARVSGVQKPSRSTGDITKSDSLAPPCLPRGRKDNPVGNVELASRSQASHKRKSFLTFSSQQRLGARRLRTGLGTSEQQLAASAQPPSHSGAGAVLPARRSLPPGAAAEAPATTSALAAVASTSYFLVDQYIMSGTSHPGIVPSDAKPEAIQEGEWVYLSPKDVVEELEALLAKMSHVRASGTRSESAGGATIMTGAGKSGPSNVWCVLTTSLPRLHSSIEAKLLRLSSHSGPDSGDGSTEKENILVCGVCFEAQKPSRFRLAGDFMVRCRGCGIATHRRCYGVHCFTRVRSGASGACPTFLCQVCEWRKTEGQASAAAAVVPGSSESSPSPKTVFCCICQQSAKGLLKRARLCRQPGSTLKKIKTDNVEEAESTQSHGSGSALWIHVYCAVLSPQLVRIKDFRLIEEIEVLMFSDEKLSSFRSNCGKQSASDIDGAGALKLETTEDVLIHKKESLDYVMQRPEQNDPVPSYPSKAEVPSLAGEGGDEPAPCMLCGVNKGHRVLCSHGGCKQMFHVWCLRKAMYEAEQAGHNHLGAALQISVKAPASTADPVEAVAVTSCGTTIEAYCPSHAPPVRYCVCQGGFDGASETTFMVGCDTCGDWLHSSCIGPAACEVAIQSDVYQCNRCADQQVHLTLCDRLWSCLLMGPEDWGAAQSRGLLAAFYKVASFLDSHGVSKGHSLRGGPPNVERITRKGPSHSFFNPFDLSWTIPSHTKPLLFADLILLAATWTARAELLLVADIIPLASLPDQPNPLSTDTSSVSSSTQWLSATLGSDDSVTSLTSSRSMKQTGTISGSQREGTGSVTHSDSGSSDHSSSLCGKETSLTLHGTPCNEGLVNHPAVSKKRIQLQRKSEGCDEPGNVGKTDLPNTERENKTVLVSGPASDALLDAAPALSVPFEVPLPAPQSGGKNHPPWMASPTHGGTSEEKKKPTAERQISRGGLDRLPVQALERQVFGPYCFRGLSSAPQRWGFRALSSLEAIRALIKEGSRFPCNMCYWTELLTKLVERCSQWEAEMNAALRSKSLESLQTCLASHTAQAFGSYLSARKTKALLHKLEPSYLQCVSDDKTIIGRLPVVIISGRGASSRWGFRLVGALAVLVEETLHLREKAAVAVFVQQAEASLNQTSATQLTMAQLQHLVAEVEKKPELSALGGKGVRAAAEEILARVREAAGMVKTIKASPKLDLDAVRRLMEFVRTRLPKDHGVQLQDLPDLLKKGNALEAQASQKDFRSIRRVLAQAQQLRLTSRVLTDLQTMVGKADHWRREYQRVVVLMRASSSLGRSKEESDPEGAQRKNVVVSGQSGFLKDLFSSSASQAAKSADGGSGGKGGVQASKEEAEPQFTQSQTLDDAQQLLNEGCALGVVCDEVEQLRQWVDKCLAWEHKASTVLNKPVELRGPTVEDDGGRDGGEDTLLQWNLLGLKRLSRARFQLPFSVSESISNALERRQEDLKELETMLLELVAEPSKEETTSEKSARSSSALPPGGAYVGLRSQRRTPAVLRSYLTYADFLHRAAESENSSEGQSRAARFFKVKRLIQDELVCFDAWEKAVWNILDGTNRLIEFIHGEVKENYCEESPQLATEEEIKHLAYGAPETQLSCSCVPLVRVNEPTFEAWLKRYVSENSPTLEEAYEQMPTVFQFWDSNSIVTSDTEDIDATSFSIEEKVSDEFSKTPTGLQSIQHFHRAYLVALKKYQDVVCEGCIDGDGDAETSPSKGSPERGGLVEALIQYAVVLLTHFLVLQRGSEEVLKHPLYKPWTRCVLNGLRSAGIPVRHVPGLLIARNSGMLGKTRQKFRCLCLTDADEDILTRSFQRCLSLWACTERKSKALEQMAKMLSPDELESGIHFGEDEPTLCILSYWPHSTTSQTNVSSFQTAVPFKKDICFSRGSAALQTTCIYGRFLESVDEDHTWMFQIVRNVVVKPRGLLLQEKQTQEEGKAVFEIRLLNLLGMSTWCLRARSVIEAVKCGSNATKGLLHKVAETLGEAGPLKERHCQAFVEHLIWARYTWNSLGAEQEAAKRQKLQEELKGILDQGLHWCMGAMKELLVPLSVHLYVPQLYGITLPLVLGDRGAALREPVDHEPHPMQMLKTYLTLHSCGVPQLLVFLSATGTTTSNTAGDVVAGSGWMWPLLAPDNADAPALHPLRLLWDTATENSLNEALTLFLEFQLFVQKQELSVLDPVELTNSCLGEEVEVTGSTDLQQFSQRFRAAERYLQTCCVLRDKTGSSGPLARPASQRVGSGANSCLTVTPPAVLDFYEATVNAQRYLSFLANPRFEKRLFYSGANTASGTTPWTTVDPRIKCDLILRNRAREAAFLIGLSSSHNMPSVCSVCPSNNGLGFLKGTCLRWIRQVLRCGLLGWTSMEMGASEPALEGTSTCATLGHTRSRASLVEVMIRFLLSSMRDEEVRLTEFIATRPSHCIDSQQPLVRLLEIRCCLVRWAMEGLQFLRDLSELEEKKEGRPEDKGSVAAELSALERLCLLQNEYHRLHAAARAHARELQKLYETSDTVIALVESFMGPASQGLSSGGAPASAFAVDWNVIQRTIISEEAFGGFLQDALARNLNRVWKRLTQTEEWLTHGSHQPTSMFEELRWMTAWETCIAPFFTDKCHTGEPATKAAICFSLGRSTFEGSTTPLATSPSIVTFQKLFLREKTLLHQKQHFLARVEGLLCRLYAFLFTDYLKVCEEQESSLRDNNFVNGPEGLGAASFYPLRAQKALVLNMLSTRQMDQQNSRHQRVLIRAVHLSHDFGFYHIDVALDGPKGLCQSFLVHPFLLLSCLISLPHEKNRPPPGSVCKQFLRDVSRLHDSVVDLEGTSPSASSRYIDAGGAGDSASEYDLSWQELFDTMYGALTAPDMKKRIRIPAFLLFPLRCIRWKRQVTSLSLPSVAPYDILQKLASEVTHFNLQRGHILGPYLHVPIFLDMATFSRMVIGPLLELGIVLWGGNGADATVDQTCLVEFQKCLLSVVPEVSGVPQPQTLFIQNQPFDFCRFENKALTHRLAAVQNAMQQYDQAVPLLFSAQQAKHLGVLCLAAPGHPTSALNGGCSLRTLLAPALKVRFEQGVTHVIAERLLMYAEELSAWEGSTRYVLERLQARQELQHSALQHAQAEIKMLPSLSSGVGDQLIFSQSVSTLQQPLTTLDNFGCETGGFSESMLRALYDGFGLTTSLAQLSKAASTGQCDLGHSAPLLIGDLDAIASSTSLKRLQERGHSLYVLRRTGHVEALARQLDEVVTAVQHLSDQGARLLAAAQNAGRAGVLPTRMGSAAPSSKQPSDVPPSSALPSDAVPSVAELETFLQQSLFADLPCHPKLKHLYWRCLALHHISGIAFGATPSTLPDSPSMADDVVPPTFLPTWLENFMESHQKPSLEASDIEGLFSDEKRTERRDAEKTISPKTASTKALLSHSIPRDFLLYVVYKRCLPSWCPVRCRVRDQAFGRCWSYAVSCLFQYGDPHATGSDSSPLTSALSSRRVTQPLLKTLQSLYAVGQRVTAAVTDSKYDTQRCTGDHALEAVQRLTLYQEQLTSLKILLTAAKNILTEARGSLDAWIRLRMIVHFFPVNFLEEMRVIQAKLQHKYPTVSIRVITSGSNIQEIQLAKDGNVRSRYKPPPNFPCTAPSSPNNGQNDAGPSPGKETGDPQSVDAVAMLLKAYGSKSFLAPQDATTFRHAVETRLRQSTTRCLQILFDDGKESSAEEREAVLFRASQQRLGESYFTALQHMLSKRLQQCITVQRGTATHSTIPRRTSSNTTNAFPLIPNSLTGKQLNSENSTASATSLKSLLSAVASSRLGRSSNTSTETSGTLGGSTSPLAGKRVQFSSDNATVATNQIVPSHIGEAPLEKLSPLEAAGFLWQGLLQGTATDVSAHTTSVSSSSIAMPIWLVPLFTPVSDSMYTLFRGIKTLHLEGAMSINEFGKQVNPLLEEPEDSPQRATLLLHVIVAAEWERQDADYQGVISSIRPRTLPIFATAPTSLRNQLSPSQREAMETRALANHLKVLCFSSVKPSQIQKPLSLVPLENAGHKTPVRFWIIPPAPTLTETALSAKIPKSSQLVFGLLQIQSDALTLSTDLFHQFPRPTNLPFASIRSVATRIVRAMRTLREKESQDITNDPPLRDSRPLTAPSTDSKNITNQLKHVPPFLNLRISLPPTSFQFQSHVATVRTFQAASTENAPGAEGQSRDVSPTKDLSSQMTTVVKETLDTRSQGALSRHTEETARPAGSFLTDSESGANSGTYDAYTSKPKAGYSNNADRSISNPSSSSSVQASLLPPSFSASSSLPWYGLPTTSATRQCPLSAQLPPEAATAASSDQRSFAPIPKRPRTLLSAASPNDRHNKFVGNISLESHSSVPPYTDDPLSTNSPASLDQRETLDVEPSAVLPEILPPKILSCPRKPVNTTVPMPTLTEAHALHPSSSATFQTRPSGTPSPWSAGSSMSEQLSSATTPSNAPPPFTGPARLSRPPPWQQRSRYRPSAGSKPDEGAVTVSSSSSRSTGVQQYPTFGANASSWDETPSSFTPTENDLHPPMPQSAPGAVPLDPYQQTGHTSYPECEPPAFALQSPTGNAMTSTEGPAPPPVHLTLESATTPESHSRFGGRNPATRDSVPPWQAHRINQVVSYQPTAALSPASSRALPGSTNPKEVLNGHATLDSLPSVYGTSRNEEAPNVPTETTSQTASLPFSVPAALKSLLQSAAAELRNKKLTSTSHPSQAGPL